MTQTIEVIVSPTGETKIETKGFIGSSCRDASRFIEQPWASGPPSSSRQNFISQGPPSRRREERPERIRGRLMRCICQGLPGTSTLQHRSASARASHGAWSPSFQGVIHDTLGPPAGIRACLLHRPLDRIARTRRCPGRNSPAVPPGELATGHLGHRPGPADRWSAPAATAGGNDPLAAMRSLNALAAAETARPCWCCVIFIGS